MATQNKSKAEKKYTDPETGNKKSYDRIYKEKKDGINVILVEKGKKVEEYDYEAFAKKNKNFKKKLS